MAPMTVHEPHTLKRTASAAQFDSPTPKKIQREQLQHHKAVWDAQRDQRHDASFHDEEAANTLLSRSITLALEAVGFEAVESAALESFRMSVEEYMTHYLADVRQSMLSCRRAQAIPQDFLQALHTHQLSLRSLLRHLDPPVPPSKSQFPLQIDSSENDDFQQYRSISSLLKEASEVQVKSYIPRHFPDLPDKHTYQATPDYASREQDPRKVRERATEEGRLAEEALRKLVTVESSRPKEAQHPRNAKLSMQAQRSQMWRETMSAIAREDQTGLGNAMDMDRGKQKEGAGADSTSTQRHLSIAVNAEKRYWRKPKQQR